MNMLEEHEHSWNQRLKVEGMDITGIHMVGGYEYGGGAPVKGATGGGRYGYG
jgi:hypothetical protein